MLRRLGMVVLALALFLTGSYVGDVDSQIDVPASVEAQSRYPQIRQNQVRSRHLLDGGVGAADLGTTLHAINVAAGSASGTSAIDAASAGGKILGVYWAGNQDQFVDNVVLNANGSVTVTLAANATAINNVRVVVAHGVPSQ